MVASSASSVMVRVRGSYATEVRYWVGLAFKFFSHLHATHPRNTDEHACTHTKLQDVQTRLERGGGGGTEGDQREE